MGRRSHDGGALGQQGGGRVAVQGAAQRDGHILINRLAEQVVTEREPVSLHADHLGGQRLLQRRHEPAGRFAGHGGQFGDGELTAENRCYLQQIPRWFGQ